MRVFDFWEWSAPIYETPKDVIRAFPNLRDRKLKSLHIIGLGTDLGGTGFRRESMVPCEGVFYEPLQLVFRDGSTFEFLPMARGGARMGCNTLPAGLDTGLNESDCDTQLLFGQELADTAFSKGPVSIRVTETTDYTAAETQEDPFAALWGRQEPRDCLLQRRWEYRYSLWFENGCSLQLRIGREGIGICGYRLSLCHRGQSVKVPATLMVDAKKITDRIPLIPGYGIGDVLQIYPCAAGGEKPVSWAALRGDYPNFALSMWEDVAGRYFAGLFSKHLDRPFDWYGVNCYSMESARALLADVRTAAEDPRTPENAMDLYRRFARTLESMLTQSQKDGCNGLRITGP